MKSKYAAVALFIALMVAFSGCTAGGTATSISGSPTAATQTPAAATATPEGTPAKLSGIVYTSESFGIAFNVPVVWADKCRVEGGDGWLTLYFDPHAPINADEGDGEMFCIVKKTQDIDESCFDNSKTIDINGVEYVWGEPTDVRYQQGQTGYDMYKAMQSDLQAVRNSVRAATGSEPENVIPTVTFTTPYANIYTSQALGIAFTVPENWVGSYRVEERKGSLAVFFIPQDQNPDNEEVNENHLFYIRKKTAQDSIPLDGDTEFTVDGVAYFWSIPTDVQYMGPEEDVFRAMNGDLPGILASVRVADETEPVETEPEPEIVIPTTNVYASWGLGLTFTVPKKWIGKYRVEEGDGYLAVCFNPEEPLEEYAWSGEMFTITDETSEKSQYICGEWKFERNGEMFVWGICDPFDYAPWAPEYDTFKMMMKEVSSIYMSLRSTSGQAFKNSKRLWNEVVPTKAKYTTKMGLGISFMLPKSWIGKCSIEESEDCVTFSFMPKDYDPYAYGDGWLFSIFKKTSNDDADMLDGVWEITVDGVTYICGGPTDVSYEGPEQDDFFAMGGGIQEIIDSVQAVK